MPKLTTYIFFFFLFFFYAGTANGQVWKFKKNAEKRDSTRFDKLIKPYLKLHDTDYSELVQISSRLKELEGLMDKTNRDLLIKLIDSINKKNPSNPTPGQGND